MTAFYAGSFDPFTIGHLWIARQAADMFDRLIIGIGVNHLKQNETSIEHRINAIRKLFKDKTDVTVLAYEGLTAEIARENGAGILVRGVRNSIDFEKENELAAANLKIFGMPTVFIPSEPSLAFVSSSLVRELRRFGHDTASLVP